MKHGRKDQTGMPGRLLLQSGGSGSGTRHRTLLKGNIHTGNAVAAAMIRAVQSRRLRHFAEGPARSLAAPPILGAFKRDMPVRSNAQNYVLAWKNRHRQTHRHHVNDAVCPSSVHRAVCSVVRSLWHELMRALFYGITPPKSKHAEIGFFPQSGVVQYTRSLSTGRTLTFKNINCIVNE